MIPPRHPEKKQSGSRVQEQQPLRRDSASEDFNQQDCVSVHYFFKRHLRVPMQRLQGLLRNQPFGGDVYDAEL